MRLVIGYGNTLRGDDGIGQIIASELMARVKTDAIDILTRHQLTPELVEPISAADTVFFIDASVGTQVGRIDVRPVEASTSEGAFTHHVTPESLLTASQTLYNASPRGFIISITGNDFEYRAQLSDQMQSQLPSIVTTIEGLIAEL